MKRAMPLLGKQFFSTSATLDQRVIGIGEGGIIAQAPPAHFGHDHPVTRAQVLGQPGEITGIAGSVHAGTAPAMPHRFPGRDRLR